MRKEIRLLFNPVIALEIDKETWTIGKERVILAPDEGIYINRTRELSFDTLESAIKESALFQASLQSHVTVCFACEGTGLIHKGANNRYSDEDQSWGRPITFLVDCSECLRYK